MKPALHISSVRGRNLEPVGRVAERVLPERNELAEPFAHRISSFEGVVAIRGSGDIYWHQKTEEKIVHTHSSRTGRTPTLRIWDMSKPSYNVVQIVSVSRRLQELEYRITSY